VNNELEWVDRIRRRIGTPRAAEIVLGIGDDCAIFRPRGTTEDLLFTTDLLLEDVHFRRETHGGKDVGWKALARGLSDIAAMGGTPRFFLLSLAVARWAGSRWVDGFYDGALELARREKVSLIGGDVARSDKAGCDIVVCGSVPRGQALRRDGARPGDAIYVSGRLGGSALGLVRGRGAAWRRHTRPEPRLALGRFLRERLHASAAMDLSDGLSLDLRRLCLASRTSAVIGPPPRYPGSSLQQAVHGGEDYELLFTVPAATRVPSEFEGIPLTRIGVMKKGRAGDVALDWNRLEPLGYDHFRKRPK
jgi:thiamine-monophosphate kinase